MKYLKSVVFIVLALFLLVAVVYKFIWPVTPAWLDFVVYGGAALALLVGISSKDASEQAEDPRDP